MAIGIPVVDTFNVIKTFIKFSLFIAFIALFGSFAPRISVLLKETLDRAMSSLGVVNALDLHCVAGLIGLDTFLNNLFSLIFISGTFYISGMATILTIKYSIQLFGYMMRI